jgi:hypothetical protein
VKKLLALIVVAGFLVSLTGCPATPTTKSGSPPRTGTTGGAKITPDSKADTKPDMKETKPDTKDTKPDTKDTKPEPTKPK